MFVIYLSSFKTEAIHFLKAFKIASLLGLILKLLLKNTPKALLVKKMFVYIMIVVEEVFDGDFSYVRGKKFMVILLQFMLLKI